MQSVPKNEMLIYPAIDLRGGRCVRLRQGDYAQETIFSDDPAAMGQRWVADGANVLHLVDLDGAKAGHPVNSQVIQAIVKATGVPCQVGGGIRTADHLALTFDLGVARIVLGTRALQDPAWLESMATRFPGKIVLGLDARDGMVATEGWLHTSTRSALELARMCDGWPLAGIVYTDIARDGMMSGPNEEAQAEMAAAVKLPVIASGGITAADQIVRLRDRGLAGVIIGRALYEDAITLPQVWAALGVTT
ncbi:1-(5-phosphoribosyl)-5-[(5-phosphoribosylamino)methylideneamino]imidazole-4-carboxamide isomerase [Tuwongella immobilis]|uniref:1-(5-phosphoribosyl)-5-[(5-phosphoribosylamino)methylideneamino] imidazole-4-carboxamide isomerase n=1 Tax=Tuwongella immobilis TaxID=692036 RepID=A0A6C2YTD5_9BACT|nr:1-(5-phosphoribosyl)-5-[(5-phosphoribosylamino)methylideneamino]imidazole-4-carboxamide isomerase [Tuwongella immobilis]VIP04175.1 phosphoribosylformimino-5-aminoimidazole carboxamide ribotide isomerase : 1-(5-phosphoribosyl)-5-[(5-phosphoribosylamino)methylideneamino] imidazole-4-carboxamide isomerase OS=Blastopirellula marina DSM 3645 GN=hisA PE=3 SV=1: His_biosynth [Tuwongella immobilis]VTS05714.1 phosphoribosylformimino-5-aminoimidazole carboxamide ribotide isomerase : 1-(5-phosphoribosyl)